LGKLRNLPIYEGGQKKISKGEIAMATFLMFGKYSAEAVKKISAKRTRDTAILVKKYGGRVEAMYSLLGERDLVFILNFPGVEQAMKASVALSKMTGIAFTTHPAVTVEEFDKLMARM
jgi:uncharacterized protein with GYD domain